VFVCANADESLPEHCMLNRFNMSFPQRLSRHKQIVLGVNKKGRIKLVMGATAIMKHMYLL
jgi:hypothetical protein